MTRPGAQAEATRVPSIGLKQAIGADRRVRLTAEIAERALISAISAAA
jgi:hypothetical protein